MHRNTDLAEIVTNPSPVTLHYLDIWFCGNGSYGKAMVLLGLPVNPIPKPLLVWDKKNGLRVDGNVEEDIMYAQTLFRYAEKYGKPVLRIDLKKLAVRNIINSMKIIWSESKLLINNQNTYNVAKGYVETIPIHPTDTLESIENSLLNIVWPHLIAVDYIGEFIIATMTHNLTPEKSLSALNIIHSKVRDMDWYTKAMLAWSDYEEGKLSEAELLNTYGYRAGDDYELTKPRYYERLKKPKPKIESLHIKDMKIRTMEDLAVGMHYLRSEAKRRSLIWIAALREQLIQNNVIAYP